MIMKYLVLEHGMMTGLSKSLRIIAFRIKLEIVGIHVPSNVRKMR